MKTLRFIGMAIVAIIMSVNFVACSDDDDDIDVSLLVGVHGTFVKQFLDDVGELFRKCLADF